MLETAGIDSITTIDLHQGQIQGFFEKPVNHLTALNLFADYFEGLGLDNLCVVSPDVGRAKAAKKLSDLLNADLAIMHKGRPSHNVAEITSIIGDVEGKNCILNDDMIDTAGTICAGMKVLKDQAAPSRCMSVQTHPVFSGPLTERLENSGRRRNRRVQHDPHSRGASQRQDQADQHRAALRTGNQQRLQ